MTLTEFIENRKQRRADLAAALGISQAYLSQIENRRRVPSLDLAFRIERATGGAVPAQSWVVGHGDGANVPCPGDTAPAAAPKGNKVSGARGAA